MAQDVIMLARAMELERYVVLGHSYGAFVALQNAVDYPGQALSTIVSCGLPSMRYMARVEEHLRTFEPVWLRQQVMDSWAREAEAKSIEDVESIVRDQWPFQFADPLDPRIEPYLERSRGVYAPEAAEAMAAAIPGAELVVFERSGHMPFVEETEGYLEAVGAFLDRVAG